MDSWLPDTKGISGGTFFFGSANNFTSWYWAVADADLSGSPATVATRNTGTNPSSYSGSVAVLDGTCTAAVDNAVAGQVTSILVAFDSPFVLQLGNGQSLTCFDLGGSGELWSGAGLTPSGTDLYARPMPKNVASCGLALCSFAIQFGNPPFVLWNSQDLVVDG